eukprot:ANDGO_02293.mRNA.1 ER membrane protein complex subunit 4
MPKFGSSVVLLSELPSPAGFKPSTFSHSSSSSSSSSSPATSYLTSDGVKSEKSSKDMELIQKKVAQLARSPVQKIFMVALMSYMTGSGMNIMTLLMMFMMTMQTVTPIFSVGSAFQQFEGLGVALLVPKLQYIVIHLVGFGIMLFKGHSMGLLRLSGRQFPIPESPWGAITGSIH